MRWRDTLVGATLGAPVAGPLGSLVGGAAGVLLDLRRARRTAPFPRTVPVKLQPHVVTSGSGQVPPKRAPQLIPLGGGRLQAALAAADAQKRAKQQWLLSLAKLRMSRPHPWCCIGGSYQSAATISDWLKSHNASPFEIYPDWPWQVVKGREAKEGYLVAPPPTGVLYLPGSPEAACFIDYHPAVGYDGVTWTVHQDGSWSYHHVWGEGFFDVLKEITHGVETATAVVTTAMGDALTAAQIAASFIPGIGQVVNEIVVGCETLVDVVEGKSALQIAFDGAYQAGLAAVPGLESLKPLLDPAVDFIGKIIEGARPARAAIDIVIDRVPVGPPRDLATGMLQWVLGQLHIEVKS